MASDRPRLRLVPATERDGKLIWAWRNDPAARRNSLNPGRISLAHSLRWLHAKLTDPRCLILIARSPDGAPLGQVRLDWAGRGAADVSISVARLSRGRGAATQMLRALPRKVGGRRVRRLRAVIKPENVASVVAFVKAGFRFSALVRRGGLTAYRLDKRLP